MPDLRRADLRRADLRGADLFSADLRGADLRGADLTGANLCAADLGGADLNGAGLNGTDLSRARLVGAVGVTYLAGATLVGADLACVRLASARLVRANLSGAHLAGAYLAGAHLSGAQLAGADLRGVDLRTADLQGADFRGADLRGADLRGATLTSTYLVSARLSGADLQYSAIDGTVFADVDLRKVKGLDEVRHFNRSEVSVGTIYLSEGMIPEIFLRGCGLPESFIVQIPALVAAMQPMQFYSCFISYSSKDQKFAERLHADLQNRGVRCWYAPHDLKIGEKLRVGIDESIRVHDKLLLILSKNSIESEWVEKEVETAMEREMSQKRTILFPIRLDDTVLKVESGWAADVRRSRNIGDFRRWKSHDTYSKAFEKLLHDLQASA